MNDPSNLQRFLQAQHPVYDTVVEELRQGRKRSHWMWFIFPQLAGLGQSEMARRFAISSIGEADAYLRHPVLGTRLRECSLLTAAIHDRTAEEIFGYPDYLKFHSSMTLFSGAHSADDVFALCLAKYFDGQCDHRTLMLLKDLRAR